jgi:hypothetical protein
MFEWLISLWNTPIAQIAAFIASVKNINDLFSSWKRVLPGTGKVVVNFRDEPPPVCETNPLPFVDRDHYKLIKSRLDSGLAGVYVHWGVRHAGKSITAKAVANAIWNDGRGLRFVDCAETSINPLLIAEAWFRSVMRFPSYDDDGNTPIAKYLLSGPSVPNDLESQMPPRYTIILDHFDSVMHLPFMAEFLYQLGHIAATHHKFNILLCFSNHQYASKVVNLNGGRKFSLVAMQPDYAKWSDNDISQLVDRLAPTYGLNDDQKKRLVALGTLAHCPYPIVEALDIGFNDIGNCYIDEVAQTTRNEWSNADKVKRMPDLGD